MIIPGIPGVMGWYSTRQAGFDPGIIPVFPVRSQSPALPSRRRSINTELKHFRFSSASSRLWDRFPCSPWQRAKLSREGAATTNPSPIHGFSCAAGEENPRESHPKPSPSIPEWFLGKERDEQPGELCQGPAPQELGNRIPRARSLGAVLEGGREAGNSQSSRLLPHGRIPTGSCPGRRDGWLQRQLALPPGFPWLWWLFQLLPRAAGSAGIREQVLGMPEPSTEHPCAAGAPGIHGQGSSGITGEGKSGRMENTKFRPGKKTKQTRESCQGQEWKTHPAPAQIPPDSNSSAENSRLKSHPCLQWKHLQ